jgi:GxxExxY protein
MEHMAHEIVDEAFCIHSQLGPGLLETVYEACFVHELTKRRLNFTQQVTVPIIYDGVRFEESLRLDLLVEKQIIVELKAVEAILPVHRAQLLTYLKLTRHRLGFLINFNVPVIKNDIQRMIL